MSSAESPKKPGEFSLSRIWPCGIWLAISLVAMNLLALYTFAVHPTVRTDVLHWEHMSGRENALVQSVNETLDSLRITQAELHRVKDELREALSLLQKVSNNPPSQGGTCDCFISKKEDFPNTEEFQRLVSPRELPLGFNSLLKTDTITSPIGHTCLMHKEDLTEFMSYTPYKTCPDDDALAQKLLTGGCEPLPRRRCFARAPPEYTEPLPVPVSYWADQPDSSILWSSYTCKSFACLNERKRKGVFADCLDCFDLQGRESKRWTFSNGGLDLSIEEVLSLKPGRIRIGLDIGGGTGTFAVRMRQHNVSIITTTLNFDGPFNSFISLRGVVPLYLTVSQRFPFYDNTLDIVHSMHVLSNWIPAETLEFVLFDIDRVLRPGGLFWLDHFFCIEHQLNIYVPLLEKMGYRKVKWTVGNKLDRGAELKERYLTAVLEKPMRRQ